MLHRLYKKFKTNSKYFKNCAGTLLFYKIDSDSTLARSWRVRVNNYIQNVFLECETIFDLQRYTSKQYLIHDK